MSGRKLVAAAAAIALAAVGLGAAKAPQKWGQIDDARIANALNEPQNWLVHSGNQQAWRYSGLDQINVDTVKDLKPAWVLEFDTWRAQESSAIVVDGVAYVTTAWSKVYAVDAKTGKQLWYFDPKVPGPAGAKTCCDVVNRGAAVYKGRVYFGTIDGRLIALDARTGKQVWSTMTVDPDGTLSVTSAPRVANGLVFIGNAGGDFGGRGYVSAYRADTGKQAWRFWLTPGKPGVKDNAPSDEIMETLVQPTWPGPYTEYRGGANVWNSMVYDPEFDQLYLATGNGFPWNRYYRSGGKGDNLFLASVVALDAKTGKYKWHYQEVPGEAWDLDAVSDMILTDLTIDGKPRKALMHAPKAGYFYVIDRGTGKIISGKPFVPGVTWTTGLDPATGAPIMNPAAQYDNKTPSRSYPGGGGAHSWHPTSYSPKTGLVYLQARQGPPGLFTPRPTYDYVKHIDNIGIYAFGMVVPDDIKAREPPMPPNPTPSKSYLLAWDPVKQQAAWQTEGNGGGVLATAGNLVFQGGSRSPVMGELKAFRADTGQQVWSYNTPNAILTSPVSYMIDGEQYLLVPSGALAVIGSPVDARERANGRLIAFKLNGKASLPADPPPAGPFMPPPAEQTWPAADVLRASQLYAEMCARCHGPNARGPNLIPDLRRSKALGNKALWQAIVEGGAMQATGMISWTKFLPPGGAEMIRGYVAEEARKSVKATTEQPGQGPTGEGL
jgi:quinohemoprotein ethanol dehydrogenase